MDVVYRTRLRLILERVFWFVNGGMSGGVGGDGGYVRIHAPHLDSGLRPGDDGGYGGSAPRTWIPACAGKTVWGLRPWVWMTGVWLGFGDWRNDVEPLPRTGEGTFETGS